MKTFLVMGSTRGDGGVVRANSFRDAMVRYEMDAWPVSRESVEKGLKRDKVKVQYLQKGQARMGDYIITRR